MTWTAVADAIRGRFKTLLETGGDGGAALFTVYPNSGRVEPDTGPWANVAIRETTRDQATIGAPVNRSRTFGTLFVDLFTDAASDSSGNPGTKALTDIAERVRVAFQRVTLTVSAAVTVTFRTPQLGAGGSTGSRQGKWWRIQVACPFYSDDVE